MATAFIIRTNEPVMLAGTCSRNGSAKYWPGSVSATACRSWLKWTGDEADAQREWWIKQTLLAIKALDGGVTVIGYLLGLLDNFEWEKGFWPKFGLVAVDRATMKRSTKWPWMMKLLAQLKQPKE